VATGEVDGNVDVEAGGGAVAAAGAGGRGRNSGPRWPQPVSSSDDARIVLATRSEALTIEAV
jgi:hypothetical protein